MGEARAVMRQLKEERDEIRAQLDAMQVTSPTFETSRGSVCFVEC